MADIMYVVFPVVALRIDKPIRHYMDTGQFSFKVTLTMSSPRSHILFEQFAFMILVLFKLSFTFILG